MLDLCVHDRTWLRRVCCASRRVPRPRASPRRPINTHTRAAPVCRARMSRTRKAAAWKCELDGRREGTYAAGSAAARLESGGAARHSLLRCCRARRLRRRPSSSLVRQCCLAARVGSL
eukprot:4687364-Prymnesium_polylepis.2